MVRTRDIKVIRFLALIVALCSAILPLELGGGITLQVKESWQHGIAPVLVFNAILLFTLSFYMLGNKTWVRWAFVFWLPLNFLSTILVTWKIRPTSIHEFMFLGFPILLVWFWFSYKLFWSKNSNEAVA